MFFDYKLRYFRFGLVICTLALSVIGVLVIRSASAGSLEEGRVARQMIVLSAGLTTALFPSPIHYPRILNICVIIYLA